MPQVGEMIEEPTPQIPVVEDIDVLVARGGPAGLAAAVRRSRCGDYWVEAEVFKWQAVEMLQEAGVCIRLHTAACMPIMDGDIVRGGFVEIMSGRQAILAGLTVNATADADLAHRAGCPCDNQSHEVTLDIRIGGALFRKMWTG